MDKLDFFKNYKKTHEENMKERKAMDNASLLQSQIRLRIMQTEHIMSKVKGINRFSEFSNIRVFYHKLSDVRKQYMDRLTPTGWAGIQSITANDRLTKATLNAYRLYSLIYEVRYESLAVNYDSRFFGFYNPEPFLFFDIDPDIMFNLGVIPGGMRDKGYEGVLRAINLDPSIIPKEHERIASYLMRGYANSVAGRRGDKFPIDLTIPGGY